MPSSTLLQLGVERLLLVRRPSRPRPSARGRARPARAAPRRSRPSPTGPRACSPRGPRRRAGSPRCARRAASPAWRRPGRSPGGPACGRRRWRDRAGRGGRASHQGIGAGRTGFTTSVPVPRTASPPQISTAQPYAGGVAGPAEYARYEARTGALPANAWIRRYPQRTSGAGHWGVAGRVEIVGGWAAAHRERSSPCPLPNPLQPPSSRPTPPARPTSRCSATPSATTSTAWSPPSPTTRRWWTCQRAALDVRPDARGRRHGGARPAGGGPREGRPGGDLGAQRRGVDARAVRHREARRHPRQHQPGLPHARAGVRAEPGRDRAAGRGHELQDVRLRGDDQRGAAELPRAARGGAAGHARLGRAGRRRAGAATAPSWRACRPSCRPTTRSTSSTRRAPRASPRAPRSRTTTSSTTATSSDGCATTAPTTGSASPCPSTTASAW